MCRLHILHAVVQGLSLVVGDRALGLLEFAAARSFLALSSLQGAVQTGL